MIACSYVIKKPASSFFDITICDIKKSGRGGVRKMPHAFTEQGVAMLSGILNSDRAIAVNIQIMRTFTKLRHMLSDNEDLRRELAELREQTLVILK